MVTLIGFFFIILSYALSVIYAPFLVGEAPRIVYVIHAICLFLYQTLDALDGKHARRTGNSSPLGELFDHGCDAVSTTMVVLTVLSVIQFGTSYESFFIVIISNFIFFTAQWEQYTVGSLELGYINVTEAQFSTMTIYLLTAYFGPSWWLTPIHIGGYNLRYHHLLLVMQTVIVVATIAGNVYDVFKAINQKKLSYPRVFGQLIPATATTAIATLWVLHSQVNPLKVNPQAFLMSLGLLFANLVGRIVFSRMCRQDFSWFQVLVVPLLVGYLNAISDEYLMPEKYLVWGLAVLYFLAYAHFARSVIDVICALLNIKCLTPKPKPKET
jgi:phosphatidylglycerophosphate synthase